MEKREIATSMTPDTSHFPPDLFAATRWSVVLAAGDSGHRVCEIINSNLKISQKQILPAKSLGQE
jgi:hypothetical protein